MATATDTGSSIDVPLDQLIQFVSQLSHESRIQLINAAFSVPVDTDMLEEPGLEELNIGQIESGTKPRLMCPHVGCEALYDASRIHAVAAFRRVETPYNVQWVDVQKGICLITFPDESYVGGWKDLGFYCPECGQPTALPPKFQIG